MSGSDLDTAFDTFWDDLLFMAEASGEPQARAFFQLYADLAAGNGDCTDLTYTPVRKEGKGGYQIDGFALEADRGDLYLAVSDFRHERDLETLNTAQIGVLFERARRFCEFAVQPDFIRTLEEVSPAFEAAWPICSARARIRRIRVIIFSNARLSTRRKPEVTGEVAGVPFVCSVLDFARYVDIQSARNGSEPIEIDVPALWGGPLPCLPAHNPGGDYESYLIAMPGELLAQIYGLWGARLLEQNVRTFLQAKTKVNNGIIRTLETAPDMFFGYNNGLTATAAAISTVELADGSVGITGIENLQIVNGGQTTASILYAKDQKKADLSKVYVQVKLSVVNSPRLDEIVQNISRYANTQNKVSEADFFSSHPFHVLMQQISRRLSAPARPGALSGSKWFYERARGQYRNRLAYGTAAERKRFELEFPKEQMIEKPDLAKYETTFDCRPHIVSRLAQKCFLDFAERVGKTWETSEATFNDHWFRLAIAKAIVSRSLDKMIGRSEWYQADRGFKLQTVAYTIAWLVQHLQDRGLELDLELIWNRQELPEEVGAALMEIAPQVARTLSNAPPQVKNVGEWCKQQACWASVAGSAYTFEDRLEPFTVDRNRVKEDRRDAAAVRRIDRDIDFDRIMVELMKDAGPVTEFARRNRLLTPKSDAALRRLTRGDVRLASAERNALKYMLEKMRDLGFELTAGDPVA